MASSATAIDTAYSGIRRLALREPSIGSITTWTGPPPAIGTWPRSSETAVRPTPTDSSSAKIASSAAVSITSVRSPPSPRLPVATERSAIFG